MNLNQQLPANPALLDLALQEFNELLKLQFPWLNQAFGKSQKLVRETEKKQTIFYPAIFAGVGLSLNSDYQNLLPNDTLGNFSFWAFDDPFEVAGTRDGFFQGTAKFSLIFWFDLRTIFSEPEKRNIEKLKEDISNFIYRTNQKQSVVTLESIYENSENVYRGYTLSEVKHQYAMHPFGCLRFAGKLRVRTFC